MYVYLCTCGEIREQLVEVAFPFTMWEETRDETLLSQMANVLTHRVILLALGYMLTLMTLFRETLSPCGSAEDYCTCERGLMILLSAFKA